MKKIILGTFIGFLSGFLVSQLTTDSKLAEFSNNEKNLNLVATNYVAKQNVIKNKVEGGHHLTFNLKTNKKPQLKIRKVNIKEQEYANNDFRAKAERADRVAISEQQERKDSIKNMESFISEIDASNLDHIPRFKRLDNDVKGDIATLVELGQSSGGGSLESYMDLILQEKGPVYVSQLEHVLALLSQNQI